MSKKERILREVEEAERRNRESSSEKPYSPRRMNAERMPIGCWLWVLAAIAGAVFGVLKLSGVLH